MTAVSGRKNVICDEIAGYGVYLSVLTLDKMVDSDLML